MKTTCYIVMGQFCQGSYDFRDGPPHPTIEAVFTNKHKAEKFKSELDDKYKMYYITESTLEDFCD